MKISSCRFFVLAILAAVMCLPVRADGDCACNPLEQAFKAQILQTESERYSAMVKPDYSVLEKLLADNIVYSHSTGNVQSKRQFIDDLKSGKMRYRKITPVVPIIRFYGNIAIVNGVADFEVTLNGADLQSRLAYTAIYFLKGENTDRIWQLVSWHSSAVPVR